MKRITRFLGGLNNGLTRLYLFIGTLCVVLVVVGVIWTCNGVKKSSLSLGVDEKIDCTPNIVDRMRAIGQWEFLTISDEELIDTIRKGFFSDDELVRIYYGKLRLGIDLSDCSEDWIKQKDDTIYVTIPEVRLLDQNFIDEARTKSFFESGKWSNADRQAMYDRARERMIRRCMSPENKKVARENATEQVQKMLAPIASPKPVKVK